MVEHPSAALLIRAYGSERWRRQTTHVFGNPRLSRSVRQTAIA